MDKLRQELIAKAADPETDISEIRAGLSAIEGGGPEETKSGFMNEKDARFYAGNLSRSTLYQWMKNGLRSFKRGGRRMFRPEDLDDFIMNGGVS